MENTSSHHLNADILLISDTELYEEQNKFYTENDETLRNNISEMTVGLEVQNYKNSGRLSTRKEDEEEKIRAHFKEQAEEIAKIEKIQSEIEKIYQWKSSDQLPTVQLTLAELQEVDARSVYVGNVDYNTKVEELKTHFSECGMVKRASILSDKVTGHPKGFAYVEFESKESVIPALAMNETLFKGRHIMVMLKRTNRPGVGATNRFRCGKSAGYGGCARTFVRGVVKHMPSYHREKYSRPY